VSDHVEAPDISQPGSVWRFRILLVALIAVSVAVVGLIAMRFLEDSGGQQSPVAIVLPTATEEPVEILVTQAPSATAVSTQAPTTTPTATAPAATPTLPATVTEPTPVLVAPDDSVEVVVFSFHGRPIDHSDPDSMRIWLDTGIDLIGEPVVLTAIGSVTEQMGGAGWPPIGMDTDSCDDPVRPCVAPLLSRYALIGILEGQPTPFLIGEEATFTGTGRLYLAFNDGNFQDNCLADPPACGAWTVTIKGVFERSTGS
jgi:hypothetical protein